VLGYCFPEVRHKLGIVTGKLLIHCALAYAARFLSGSLAMSHLALVFFQFGLKFARHDARSRQHHVAVNVVRRPKRKNVRRWVILEPSSDRFEWNWSQPERTADLLQHSDDRIRVAPRSLSPCPGCSCSFEGLSYEEPLKLRALDQLGEVPPETWHQF
jgi:hypothetical protein